ncbi:MAG TPA: alpha/beta hydrolase [Phycisphaerales bacterium]|nr:alpha/beta hydrolase [Phycisphaerales bacterium]
MDQVRLVMLPGLGARGFMYAPQRGAFPELEVVEWIPHVRGETLAEYAGRMAATVGGAGPVVIGGISFGGHVALEMVQHLRARMEVRGVVLIAASRTARGVRPVLRGLAWLAPYAPARVLQPIRVPLIQSGRWLLGPLNAEGKRVVAELARRVDARFALWSYGAMARWPGINVERLGVPVWEVHGSRDRVIPVGRVTPDRVVEGGGHLVNVTHAAEVNAFLAEVMERAASR